jgi:primase-polymerase (primpol)-like protein
MTDEQINEIIGQEIGWHYVDGWHHEDGREGLPDFCNNHKAMIKAENWLMNIDPQSWDEYYCSFEKSLCCSTERQRAENFLKVLGKWKE